MSDAFAGNNTGLSSPAPNAAAVTPSDVTSLQNVSRSIYVGTGGDVAVVMVGGQTVTFPAVPNGALLPVRVKQVLSSGTTASNIVALW